MVKLCSSLAFTDEDGDIIITLGSKAKEHGASKSSTRSHQNWSIDVSRI